VDACTRIYTYRICVLSASIHVHMLMIFVCRSQHVRCNLPIFSQCSIYSVLLYLPRIVSKTTSKWFSSLTQCKFNFCLYLQNDDVMDGVKEVTKVESISEAKATAVDSIPERVAVLAGDNMNSWMASVVQSKLGVPTVLVGEYSLFGYVTYVHTYMHTYLHLYIPTLCTYLHFVHTFTLFRQTIGSACDVQDHRCCIDWRCIFCLYPRH
jgi:hypothetical protein